MTFFIEFKNDNVLFNKYIIKTDDISKYYTIPNNYYVGST